MLVAEFKDAANPLNPASLKTTFNGQPVPAQWLKITPDENGKTLRCAVDLQQALASTSPTRRHVLEISVADKSVGRHAATVLLTFMVRQPQEAGVIYLSDLTPISSFAHGGLIRDTDYVGNPAQIGDVAYPKCLTLCPEPSPQGEHGRVVYEVPAGQEDLIFKSDIGISTSASANGSVEFLVQVADTPDGEWKTLYTSPVLRGGQPQLVVEVPLQGAKFLRLYTTSAADGISSDHALWGSARLTPAK